MARIDELIIPRTEARLAPYVTILAALGGYDALTGPGANQNAFTQVGGLTSLTIESTREVGDWRQLGHNYFALIEEKYPQLINYELTLKGVVLYRSNILERLGFYGEDLMNQTAPLQLQIALYSPGTGFDTTSPATVGAAPGESNVYQPKSGAASLGKNRLWTIDGVWLTSLPLTFDISGNGDLKIEQEVKASAQNIHGDR